MWQDQPEVMKDALQVHFAQIEDAVDQAGGRVFNHAGDGLVASFDHPAEALVAAAEAQRVLQAADPTPLGRLHSRMGIHFGPCYEYVDRFSGQALNRCARLNGVGHARQVLVSGATAALLPSPLPAQLELLSLGEYWLRDIREAEHVFQLVGPGLQLEFPPIRTAETSQSRLPYEAGEFIGRSAEVQRLEELLQGDGHRLITLTGEAGVGKTRLARHIVGQLARLFRDGAHWLDLSSVQGDEMLSALGGSLGVPIDQENKDSMSKLAASIATQELIIVIDNCESDPAAVKKLAQAILAKCPQVRLLATSRQVLELEDETRWIVRPLETSGTADDPEPEALRLFVERANHVAPQITFDAATYQQAAKVVQALDGVPLAIEQAAASLDVQSIDDLVRAAEEERLSEVPGFERVLSAIDRTARFLDEAQSTLLEDLVVFRGTFTADAVAEVCRSGRLTSQDVHRLLTDLRRLSFIQPTDTHGRSSFRMLEPIRAYARSRSDPSSELLRRHEHYFVRAALRHGSEFRQGDQRETRASLETAWSDIRAVVRRLIDRQDYDSVADVVEQTHEYCLFALIPDAYVWADAIATRVSQERRAALTGIQSLGAWVRGDMEEAREIANRSLAIDSETEDARFAHRALMNTFMYLGQIGHAVPHYMRLNEINRTSAEAFWQVDALASESIGSTQIGQLDRAQQYATAATELANQTKNQSCLSWAYFALGFALAPVDPVRARHALERAVYEADLVGSHWNANNARLELLLLRRRLSTTKPEFTFDIEGAQIAWDLLGRFDRARANSQLWQVVMETSWMLAQSGYPSEAGELFSAVKEKPRMPRADGDDIDQHVADLLPVPPAEVSYLADDQIIELCREGLRQLLGVD